ncbi:MAG: hypothetical protein ACYDBQ_06305 [Thermoplasmatota archaeon]
MSDCQDLLQTLPPVSPAVRCVACALYGHHLTGAELRVQTGLPRRTLYGALQRLQGLGLLGRRASLRDTRQTLFWIVGAPAI